MYKLYTLKCLFSHMNTRFKFEDYIWNILVPFKPFVLLYNRFLKALNASNSLILSFCVYTHIYILFICNVLLLICCYYIVCFYVYISLLFYSNASQQRYFTRLYIVYFDGDNKNLKFWSNVTTATFPVVKTFISIKLSKKSWMCEHPTRDIYSLTTKNTKSTTYKTLTD